MRNFIGFDRKPFALGSPVELREDVRVWYPGATEGVVVGHHPGGVLVQFKNRREANTVEPNQLRKVAA